jgi:translation initiation factor IF-2
MATEFRPPIVVIMGHIDHGKTTLLDKIRSTNLWRKEAGGITQHIGAYQASVATKSGNRLITFIDTPGHAAFCQMRARGAKITDIAILVISAQDGVMAQTKECLEHITSANLPLIVAINKIDLPGANLDKVRGQLVESHVIPEDYGGQTACIPVSAKTGEGIDKLLDMILLNADILELKSKPDSPLEAFVVESRLDPKRGPVASIIVKNGTLRLGDQVFCDSIPGKVKAMTDHNRQPIKSAGPSQPVEILGFEQVPAVGTLILDHLTKKTAELPNRPKIISGSDTPKLPVIIKADVQGTLEALLNSFSDDVQIILAGIGPVSDTDVFLAQSASAQIFAFNVPTVKSVRTLAESNQVTIFESKIIYEIIENIQSQVLKLLEPTIDETILGEGKIIAEFKIEKVRIAGIQCTKGELTKGSLIHLKRDNKIIKDTKIEGIHQGKNIVDSLKASQDCGMTFKPYVDFKLNDVIISYKT